MFAGLKKKITAMKSFDILKSLEIINESYKLVGFDNSN